MLDVSHGFSGSLRSVFRPVSTALLTLLLLLPASLRAANPPGTLNYQGLISVGATAYTGTGYFKFALVDSGPTETFWSNDGTGTGTPGSQPTAAVTATVSQGRYTVRLGDTTFHANMNNGIGAGVFTGHADVRLRVWFSTNNVNFELLAPDQRLLAAGYALSADTAMTLAGTVAASQLTGTINDARLSGNVSLLGQTIDSLEIASGAIGSNQLTAGAVNTAALSDGAVTLPKLSPSYLSTAPDIYSGVNLTAGGGLAQFAIAFDTPFPAGAPPQVTLSDDWTLTGSSATGFTATATFSVPTVVTGNRVGETHSLAIVAGRPAIAFSSQVTFPDFLQYVRANDENGATWGTPITVAIPNGPFSNNRVGNDPRLLEVNGHPAIACYRASIDGFIFIRATDSIGSAWGPEVTVDTQMDFNASSLVIVNGNPALAGAQSGFGPTPLRFARANDANGTSWTSMTVDTEAASGPSLAIVNGLPAISYADFNNNFLYFRIATDANGTSWGPRVQVDTGLVYETSLTVVNGRPAIAYDLNGKLRYVIANDATGSSWGSPVTTIHADFIWNPSLQEINGRPAIGYYEYSPTSRALFVIANDVSGASWGTPVVVDGSAPGYAEEINLLTVNGNPSLSFFDENIPNTIKFARLPVAPDWTALNGEAHPFYAQGANSAAALRVAGAIGNDGLRVEAPTGGPVPTPNLVGGYGGNSIAAGAVASVIAGGGSAGSENKILASGWSSSIGGGESNTVANFASTVAGGAGNAATTAYAAVGGGQNNRATGLRSTVGGGQNNTAIGNVSTVSGGANNIASGGLATVPGGSANEAAGTYSFAAGRRAKASHSGAFVWADSTDADFASTGNDQFLIRASGGVGIGTASPVDLLSVVGQNTRARVESTNATYAGYIAKNSQAEWFTGINPGAGFGTWAIFQNSPSSASRLVVTTSGNIGIGTTDPSHTLTVQNTSNEETMRLLGPDALGSGARLNFGDGDFVYLDEPFDDGLTIQANEVGIGGDPADGGAKLQVFGNASKSVAGDWLANSDRRIKQDIQPVAGALDTLNRVRLVSFRYTDQYRHDHPSVQERRYLNVVAQEFAEVFPEHVKSSGEKLPDGSEILQVDTWPVTIYSAAAIQELDVKQRELRAQQDKQIGELKSENAALRERQDRLASDNASLRERLERLEKMATGLASNK